ncbi:unnamed protein product [Dovyalis caffra]|uniref:Uncharacterized protein n=1 Tax=Dovyalis caffra TaxID=77055 RepID=A0AAV1SBZ0_9ROSI|nr:unnamed protein product [Dovyalis caffra]
MGGYLLIFLLEISLGGLAVEAASQKPPHFIRTVWRFSSEVYEKRDWGNSTPIALAILLWTSIKLGEDGFFSTDPSGKPDFEVKRAYPFRSGFVR